MSKNIYAILYLLVVVWLITLEYWKPCLRLVSSNTERQRKWFLLLVAVAMGVFAAIRPFDMPDTDVYLSVFQGLKNPSFYLRKAFVYGSRENGMEHFFLLLLSLFRSAGLSFRLFLFVVAFLNCFTILYFSCRIADEKIASVNLLRVLIVFLAYFGLHYCCIALRGGLSLSCSVAAMYFFYRRRKVRALVLVYIAMLFHSMGIFTVGGMLLVWLAERKKIERGYHAEATLMVSCVSLLFNLGAVILTLAMNLPRIAFKKLGIEGFSAYLYGYFDLQVGIKDWFFILSVGLLTIWIVRNSRLPVKLQLLVLPGLLILAFCYPIRAINRAADYFFIYLLPAVAATDNRRITTAQGVLVSAVVYPMMLAITYALV